MMKVFRSTLTGTAQVRKLRSQRVIESLYATTEGYAACEIAQNGRIESMLEKIDTLGRSLKPIK